MAEGRTVTDTSEDPLAGKATGSESGLYLTYGQVPLRH